MAASINSTSVPPSGELTMRALPPWRSIRPRIDSRTPRRSAGMASGSKPGPRSRTNTWVRCGPGLGVHVDRVAAAELGGVDHGLAGGGHERLGGGVQVAVAHGDDLDGHAVGALDVGRRVLQRPRQPPGGLVASAPTASRAARAPGCVPAPRPRAGRGCCAGPGPASAAPSRAGARPARRAPASGSARTARRSASAPAASPTGRRSRRAPPARPPRPGSRRGRR